MGTPTTAPRKASTLGGTPVYNVSLPFMVAADPEMPLRILDLAVGGEAA